PDHHRWLIGCLDYGDQVVGSLRPVEPMHLEAALLQVGLIGGRPLHGAFDVLGSLVSEVVEHDIGWHGLAPSWLHTAGPPSSCRQCTALANTPSDERAGRRRGTAYTASTGAKRKQWDGRRRWR